MTTSAELAGATTSQVAAARAALTSFLQASYPTLSLTAGPLADAVLGPSADALAAVEAVAEQRVAALSPETALASGDYDETTLAAALAGRGVTRRTSSAASGTAVIVFSTDTQVPVPGSYRLAAADGTNYKPTNPVTIKPSTATTVLATDVKLVALPEGGYAAAIGFTAVASGQIGNRTAGVTLTATTNLANQTAAYAGTDFTGGADTESDADLLTRLPSASAPRSATSATGITRLITEASPEISTVAVQGYGHAGLRRARSALGLQSPGKADARIRTADSPGRLVLRVTATYQGVVGPYTSWRFTAAAEDVPGWFYVEKVIKAGAKVTTVGYTPSAVTRGFDTAADTNPPDVRTAADAAYSTYATAQVTFSDPDTPSTGLTIGVSTKTYDAVVRFIPGVRDGQTAVLSESVRASGGDCLVRAAVPVLVSVTAAAVRSSGSTLTAAAVATAVAQAINDTGIHPTLNGASVAAGAVAYLPVGTSLSLTGWSGTAYAETGNVTATASTSGLTLTTDWTNGIGPDAVAYYADAGSITATVE